MKELVFLPDREGRDEFASVSGLVRLGADGDTLQKLSDRLVLPADRELREDINAMHRKISTGGNIQFTAPRRPDGHSDRACAIALAVDCAERNARRGPIIMPEVLVAPAQFRARRLA